MVEKVSILAIFFVTVLFACHDMGMEDLSHFTGNETVYVLQSGSEHGLSGTVTFLEMKDRRTRVTVALDKVESGMRFPVHMHLGGVDESNTDIMAVLNPVMSGTGMSTTTLSHLADGTLMTYEDMLGLESCVKVHLSDVGEARNVVLAGGNTGRFGMMRSVGRNKGFGFCGTLPGGG